MRYEYIKSEFFSFLSQKMQLVSEAYRQLPYYLRRSLLLIWYFFPSVLPNGNQCQHHPLNCIQVPSRSFSLTLYAVLAEVAVKIPVHAFNSLMLLGYLTKPLCTASQAWNIHSLFRCNPTIRLFLRRCEYFYNCQIAIPFFLVDNKFFSTVWYGISLTQSCRVPSMDLPCRYQLGWWLL